MSAAQTRAAVTPDGVDFVDEDNAGCILFALLKQVTDAAGADAHKHLHEIRTGDREKWNVGFAGDRAGQQSLARARRSHEQHALRDSSAELLEFLGIFQEFDNLAQLFLGLIHARHVLERDLLLLHGEQPRPALAERQRLVPARLHLADHEEPQRTQQDQRRPRPQKLQRPAAIAGVFERDVHTLVTQDLDHVGVVGRDRGVEGGIIQMLAGNLHPVHGDFPHFALVHVTHELGEIDILDFLAAAARLNHLPQQ